MDHTTEDSLKVKYDEDSQEFTISWDSNDPKWSFLNNLSDDELEFIKKAFIYGIQNNILDK